MDYKNQKALKYQTGYIKILTWLFTFSYKIEVQSFFLELFVKNRVFSYDISFSWRTMDKNIIFPAFAASQAAGKACWVQRVHFMKKTCPEQSSAPLHLYLFRFQQFRIISEDFSRWNQTSQSLAPRLNMCFSTSSEKSPTPPHNFASKGQTFIFRFSRTGVNLMLEFGMPT